MEFRLGDQFDWNWMGDNEIRLKHGNLTHTIHGDWYGIPTFGCFLWSNMVNVGKYTIQGCYG